MDTLLNRQIKGYTIREKVGAGGFGAVYRAVQSPIEREVAIKVILPQYANQPDFVRRFEVEAQVVARLEHPHIVPLYDYWRDPEGAYLVMRWLRSNLRASLERNPWSLEAAARLLDQIGPALTVAHREGIVHRDIKPDNILLDEDENAYLADFGIAKDVHLRNTQRDDEVAGSPAYLSPEQIRSDEVTARTDLYSLGYVVYELLTGEKPFTDAKTPSDYIMKHLTDPMPMLSIQHTHIPAAVDEVLQTVTAKDPSHRYINALRFATAFRAALPQRLSRISTQPLADPLTERELEVLRLMIDGLNNQEIAERLFLTLGTVRWYVKQVYSKLDSHNRQQAVERALSLKLTEPRPIVLKADPVLLDQETVKGVEFGIRVIDPENPFKGLRAFQERDAVNFFGRAALTERLLSRMVDSGENARLLTVIGPSGSGKSSIVRAGLIPALRKGALTLSPRPFIADFMPGTHPLEELEAALLRVAVNPMPNLLEQLRQDRRGLVRAAKRLLPSDTETELILIIDQFEEVFTLVTDEAQRMHFIDNLLSAATDPRGRVRIVLTLRADFYDRPLMYPRLAEIVRVNTEVIIPLTAREMEQAITAPLERVGMSMENGLTATILHDIGEQPGMLPLLQYTLTELFERREGLTLTLDAYKATGGVLGALARRAEDIYGGLDAQSQALTRQLFLRMVTLGEGTEDTRRRVLQDEFVALGSETTLEDVLNTFVQYRLLTLDRDPLTHGPTVEIAHEALIREWSRLREWLNESRTEIRLQRQVMTLADEWQRAAQDTSFLLHGSRLEIFEKWAQETTLTLTEQERAYLSVSAVERERLAKIYEEQQSRELRLAQEAATMQRRAANGLRALVAVLVMAVIGALILSGVAISNANVARTNATLATARELAASSVNILTTDPQLSLLLALRAVHTTYDIDGTWTREAEEALHRAVGAPQAQRILTGHEAALFDVAYSPDGTRLVTVSIDGTARVWDTQTGDPLLTLVQADAVSTSISGDVDETTIQHALYSVAYSPDGTRIATASRDGTAVLWDAATGAVLNIFRPLSTNYSVLFVTFSPDGTHLAFAARDAFVGDGTSHEVTVFDLATEAVVFTVPMHDAAWGFGIIGNYFDPLAFSPDGDRLAFGYFTNIEVWDIARQEKLLTLPVPAPSILDIVFSPDGRFLVGSSLDGTARVWQIGTALNLGASTTRELFNLSGSFSITFSPDGRQLAASSPDGTLKVWDFTTQTLLYTLAGHEGTIRSVVFSPDGTHLATASADETARIWQAAPGAELYTIVTPRGSPGIDYNREGTRFAAADYTVMRIWDALTGAQISSFDIGSTFGITAFSPDSTRVAAVGIGGARVWDVETGEELLMLSTNVADGLDYSPNGDFIATGGLDHIVRIWDAHTGEQVAMLEGHESGVHCLFYSPDGRYLASGGDDGIAIIWDMTTYQRAYTVPTGGDVVTDFQFSPDSTRLAINSQSDTSIIWDIPTQQTVMTISGHAGSVLSIAFSPDGTWIASGGGNTVKLWDAVTGEELLTLYGHTAALNTVRFSPNSHYLTSSATDFTARIWIIAREELLTLAETRVTRSWTQDECRRYLHLDSCPAAL